MNAENHSSSQPNAASTLRTTLMVNHIDGEQFEGLRPTTPILVRQIASRIQKEVPSYAGPVSGRRRLLITMAVGRAIDQFCAVLEDRPQHGADVSKLFQFIGRGEARDGHTLDAMGAAYQVATREAWAHLHNLASARTIQYELLTPLTKALFIYMQQLIEQVTIGYVDNSHQTMRHELELARHKLLSRLLNGRSREPIDELAQAARWTVPAAIVVVRVELDLAQRPSDLATRLTRLGQSLLFRDDVHSVTAVVPTEQASNVPQSLLSIPGVDRVAASWPVPVDQARHASLWAMRALRLVSDGLIDDRNVVYCAEHQALLWLHADPILMQHTALELLDPLLREKPHSQTVLAETLLLWLQTHASAPKLAEQLGVHEQTVRQRLRRLRDLFGDQLVDPTRALALLMALRTPTPLSTQNTQTHDKKPPKSSHSCTNL